MKAWLAGSFVILGVMALGCADTASCDPGQVFENGVCVPDVTPPPRADAGSGGVGPGAGDAAACDSDAGPDMGAPCVDGTDHSDCGCRAPYCAIRPGNTMGVCTRQGCAGNPAICPPGWQCLDLGAFMPGLSFCTEM